MREKENKKARKENSIGRAVVPLIRKLFLILNRLPVRIKSRSN